MPQTTRVLTLLAAASLGVLSGCVIESRAAGTYYYPSSTTYSAGVTYTTYATYGYSAAYQPNTVYYAGGYYGGTYYRPGYYHPSAPFLSVQAAPVQYGAPPGYVVQGQPYARPVPAQPVYGQPQPAQPVYGTPSARPVPAQPLPARPVGAPPAGTVVSNPRAGVPAQ